MDERPKPTFTLRGLTASARQPQPLQLQLLRWPPARLLTGPHYIRLAALLTGLPITQQALCRRSGLPPEICATFLNRLDAAGLLHWTTAPPPGTQRHGAALHDTQLLQHIRRRLSRFAGSPRA